MFRAVTIEDPQQVDFYQASILIARTAARGAAADRAPAGRDIVRTTAVATDSRNAVPSEPTGRTRVLFQSAWPAGGTVRR